MLYILEITKDNVKYEYLINKKLDTEKLMVFNNGAVTGGFLSIIMGIYLKGAKVVADNLFENYLSFML